jgi:hypothetical protein
MASVVDKLMSSVDENELTGSAVGLVGQNMLISIIADESIHSYSVRWHDSEKEISTDLWSKCFAPPVEGQWWYQALERSGLESQFKFAYGVILEDGEEVGIMPTFLMDVPIELVAPPALAKMIRRVGRVWPSVQ